MIKTFNTLKGEFIAVKVPDDATGFNIKKTRRGKPDQLHYFVPYTLDVVSNQRLIILPNEEYILLGISNELTEEQAAEIVPEHVKCFMCGGDGKETCNNPDHGFYSMVGFHDIGRIGCPCCGHDEDHKVPNGGNCDFCDGKGILEEDKAHEVADEYGWDNEYEEISSLDTFATIMQSIGAYSVNPFGESKATEVIGHKGQEQVAEALLNGFNKTWQEAEEQTGTYVILRKV